MNYGNHKYNNCVIEVLTREHGKEVIKWWKEQGITTRLEGNCSKAENDECRWYGIIDGTFDNYYEHSLTNKKIINDLNMEIIHECW